MNIAVGAVDGIMTLDDAIPAYRIVDHERLPPFLMTVVSASDHWLFVSSAGGLAAGRVEPARGLFSYETDDRLHHARGITGPLTVFRVTLADGTTRLWEPFDRRRDPGVRRHLTKSLAGDHLELEEVSSALGLTFRYRWSTSDAFGFVRTCTLERHEGLSPMTVTVLDGLLNLMPPLVDLSTQQSASCLVDAYKMAERAVGSTMGLYSLTSRIVDRAEPAEALRGTVAWCQGLEPEAVLLSDRQIQAFRDGRPITPEARVMGRRFAYLVTATLKVESGSRQRWRIVADVHRSQAEVVALSRRLTEAHSVEEALTESVEAGSARLRELVASADGVQRSGDAIGDAHHFANVLFNIMRGGVFFDAHRVQTDDVRRFLKLRNTRVWGRHAEASSSLPETMPYEDLLAWARRTADPDLVRLAYEYLPLTFSRRHGDPSRPWNRFTIRLRDDAGRPSFAYEGNWRDIFQNWEALSWSFPGFIESVIAKFVNASTVDGFNPYRITREGIDWEVPDPEDPWSNIGYWGDHQTIYLLKLLETSRRFHPEALDALLSARIFSYADVPYRLVSYDELLADPHDTIRFDEAMHAEIEARVATLGSDAKLVRDPSGAVLHVNLLEKLVVCLLARLSNFVPGGGIWMNTQRPEWNDANNALVGYGVSMVTLCYLRRFVVFLGELLGDMRDGEVELSGAVARWLDAIVAALTEEASCLDSDGLDDLRRRRVIDRLGRAYSAYRAEAYERGLGEPEMRPRAKVRDLIGIAERWLDHSIRASRRPDGLYHAYNLLAVSPEGDDARVDHLYEMLEGQVAVLSSGLLSAEESLSVIEALFESAMYRPDQQSFTLYPDRRLPGLLERGRLDAAAVEKNPLLVALLERHPRPLVIRDEGNDYRFDPDFRNADDLRDALDALAQRDDFGTLAR
ncbi:MAG: hypothetical protein KC731_12430, partial [Myxococcales bacterium]|nr:hypothetical protein [Myxococcales bacterium]